jgi:peptidoglycan/xylan/chitin deacetylase (PgdA/CDA1 family)
MYFVFWLLSTFLICTSSDKSKAPPSAVSKYAPGGQYVMLTFDDAPHLLSTPKVLDILKAKGTKATFFVLGSKSLFHVDLVQRIHSEGHQVANNGWKRHTVTDSTNIHMFEEQVHHTASALYNITHTNTTFYRPYMGMTNDQINKQLKSNNYKVILWSLEANSENANDIVTLAKKVTPGDVVRMPNTKTAIDALPHFIDYLTEEGYEFLTISQVSSFPDDTPH